MLKDKLYYDGKFKSAVMAKANGMFSIIFRAIDQENFYTFDCYKDDKHGFKRIRRFKNGVEKTLFKVDDGGFLLDTWYNVIVEMTGYQITIRMDIEKKVEATIEELADMPVVATVGDGTFPGGSIGFAVNKLQGFYVDDIVVNPSECKKSVQENNPFVFMPKDCSRWSETFGTDINTQWDFSDPEMSKQGPSTWKYSQRFSDYSNVVAQESKIFNPTEA